MKKLFLFITVLFFSYSVFADEWMVLDTNINEHKIGSMLQETDIININESDFIMIRNIKKSQIAIIVIPGKKTVQQGVDEAKELQKDINNIANRNRNHLWEPTYLLREDYIFFWMQEW